MNELPIKKEISDYVISATQLEDKRREIQTSLNKTLYEEIIPLVQSKLPPGYKLNIFGSKVSFFSSRVHEGVPSILEIKLKLDYEGRSLTTYLEHDKVLIDWAKKHVQPTLTELSNTYGVPVKVDGQPPRI